MIKNKRDLKYYLSEDRKSIPDNAIVCVGVPARIIKKI